MGEIDPLKALLLEGMPRPTVYLNQKRIQEFYQQSYGGIVELVTMKKRSGEIKAGFNLLVELGVTAAMKNTPIMLGLFFRKAKLY